jgi:hypothetical protein
VKKLVDLAFHFLQKITKNTGTLANELSLKVTSTFFKTRLRNVLVFAHSLCAFLYFFIKTEVEAGAA